MHPKLLRAIYDTYNNGSFFILVAITDQIEKILKTKKLAPSETQELLRIALELHEYMLTI